MGNVKFWLKQNREFVLLGFALLCTDITIKMLFVVKQFEAGPFPVFPVDSAIRLIMVPSMPLLLVLLWSTSLRSLAFPRVRNFAVTSLVVGLFGGIFEYLYFPNLFL